ncbi:molecular chaperone TorD family protein [Bacillus subtilis]|uniref:molecular chaperone TorD family protein n=1 Tax=Bacillus subtilis TaxID=1423 RepID=UPI003AEFC4FD
MCKIIGNDKLISSSITSLLAESAGIQKAYEDYTQHFIGSNSLTAPPWKSIYLDREH